MKKLLFVLLAFPVMLYSQSDDGKGNVAYSPPTELGKSNLAKGLKITGYGGEESKYKKGVLVDTFQWFNYKDELGHIRRIRREYVVDYFMYDEVLIAVPQIAAEVIHPTARRLGKQIVLENGVKDDGFYYVYDGTSKVYDDGILQASVFFKKGRPTKIYINHYYTNGQLQFVREITSDSIGAPLLNIGALEAYYPDGSVFENPVSEDGSAIIILNDDGDPEDGRVGTGNFTPALSQNRT
ncbi:MAG: hypothetical protein GY816_14450 [Cytophagales bacterium]|nr:hypothetical protein [Cytophagales bacterium]